LTQIFHQIKNGQVNALAQCKIASWTIWDNIDSIYNNYRNQLPARIPMPKNTFFAIIVWIALAGLIYYLADNIQNPNKLNRLGDGNTVVLKRGIDGHYRSEALINGKKVNVLVDTGATGVAISQNVADLLALKSIDAIRTNTANGDSIGYMVSLESVQIGGVNANDVAAMIAPNLDGDVLLGMSFLGRMDVRLYKGQMTIKQVEN
jgi:aspartyl protease family protein